MKVFDHRPSTTPPEPLTIGDCAPGEVVTVRSCPANFYLVANVAGNAYGINLETGNFLSSSDVVIQKVSVEAHVNL